MDSQAADSLKAEAIYVICKLCGRNSDIKFVVNERIVPPILELINQDISQPL
jgi:hypothetical protein